MAVFAWVHTLDGCWAMAYWLADRNGVIVAARTNSGRVVFVSGRNPCDETVAIVTCISCHAGSGMARGLVILIGANNMAARSSTVAGRDSCVIPARRDPCKRSVAAIARLSRFLSDVVACRLGSGLSAVMAGYTLPRPSTSVVVARSQKGGGIEVAAVARGIGHDMAGGFWCRHDTFAERMAAIAVSWRAFEYASCMTGLACRRGVSA